MAPMRRAGVNPAIHPRPGLRHRTIRVYEGLPFAELNEPRGLSWVGGERTKALPFETRLKT